MFTIFGDESADEMKQRVFAIAGVMGREAQWDELIDKWVKRTGGKEFHAAECESEYANDPDRDKHRENLRMYADLAQLIANSGLRGWGVSMDLAGWREFFPEVFRDIPYYKCFVEVSDRLIREAAKLGERKVKFTFDNRQESEKNTGFLYDWIVNQSEWKERNIFLDLEISFSSRKNPRIQVADLLARETMKDLDNRIGPVKRKMRRSMEALATNGRFHFEHLMREYFEAYRKSMDSGQLEERMGISRQDYAQWLQDTQQIDNMSNRFRFLIWFEAEELKRKNEPQS